MDEKDLEELRALAWMNDQLDGRPSFQWRGN